MKPCRFVSLAVGACTLVLGVSAFAFQTNGGYHFLRKISLGAAPGGSEYSLRLQKAQPVHLDFSPFVDPNANPALHQMVSQMISNRVEVTVNEANQPVSDLTAASTAAGFPAQLLTARKDAPKLVVSGRHELKMTVERSRLQEILKNRGAS